MNNSTIAVILGGGKGSRLYPLTKSRSKPAVPIGGKYRLVDIPISNCLNSDIRRIFVLTQFNSASLNRHIKNTYHFDLFRSGFVDLLAAEQTYSSQKWFQGTADAVRQSLHHLENTEHDYVLILSGDQLYQMDFTEMIKRHIDTNSQISIATIPVDSDDATGFGIMQSDESHTIKKFIEKPSVDVLDDWKSDVSEENKAKGNEYMASMGIYCFNRDALYELFNNNPDAKDFGKEIIPIAIDSNYKVSSYEFNGYWTDIGTVKSFFEANLELTDALPRFNLYDNIRTVYTNPRLLPATKISGTTLERSVVAGGGIVEASRVEHSIIGIRSRIGRGTTIVDSIIMGNDFFPTYDKVIEDGQDPHLGIGERCYIKNAIIDKNCQIGNDVRINGGSHLEDGDYGNYSVVDGIVVVPRGGILVNGSVI